MLRVFFKSKASLLVRLLNRNWHRTHFVAPEATVRGRTDAGAVVRDLPQASVLKGSEGEVSSITYGEGELPREGEERGGEKEVD